MRAVPHRAGARPSGRAARARRPARRAAARREGAPARAAPAGSAERHTHEALSAAMKLVVNSAYGYLAAGGELTRFADVHAANEVTRRGREMLDLMCRELARARRDAARGGHRRRLLRRAGGVDRGRRAARRRGGRRAAAAARAPRVRGALRGDALARAEELRAAHLRRHAHAARRRVPVEPRRAVRRGVPAARARAVCWPATSPACARRIVDDGRRAAPPRAADLRRRRRACGSRRRRREYAAVARDAARAAVRGDARERPRARRGAPWARGERVRVYRTAGGGAGVVPERDGGAADAPDPRDYDVEHYVRVLRDKFASRLARGLRRRTTRRSSPTPSRSRCSSPRSRPRGRSSERRARRERVRRRPRADAGDVTAGRLTAERGEQQLHVSAERVPRERPVPCRGAREPLGGGARRVVGAAEPLA